MVPALSAVSPKIMWKYSKSFLPVAPGAGLTKPRRMLRSAAAKAIQPMIGCKPYFEENFHPRRAKMEMMPMMVQRVPEDVVWRCLLFTVASSY